MSYDVNQEKSLKEVLEEILQRLDIIEMKISGKVVQPIVSTNPACSNTATCDKCGISFGGNSIYQCNWTECPMNTRIIS